MTKSTTPQIKIRIGKTRAYASTPPQ